MLVLNRKVGEVICIHDEILVTVLAVRGGRVRLGIQAPSHVPVHRQEIVIRDQLALSVREAVTPPRT